MAYSIAGATASGGNRHLSRPPRSIWLARPRITSRCPLQRGLVLMLVLVYKRTYNGDPDANGCFGAYDCMGVVRNWDYEAVIGVGGIGPAAQANEIAGRGNWIGIGPHKWMWASVAPRSHSTISFTSGRTAGTSGRRPRYSPNGCMPTTCGAYCTDLAQWSLRRQWRLSNLRWMNRLRSAVGVAHGVCARLAGVILHAEPDVVPDPAHATRPL